jgi:5-formyltetrahydrofolate cyclo-ligase
MREVRGAIPAEERHARAAAILDRLLALPEVAGAGGVMLFDAFGSEIPTAGFAGRFRASGARTFYPYLREGRIEAAEVDPDEPGAMAASTYGPREPTRREPAGLDAIAVVVVPGLAFDREGYRVGYGGGYYDAFLRRLGPSPSRVGVAFREQVLDEVPHGPSDERVDLLVTDADILTCRTR